MRNEWDETRVQLHLFSEHLLLNNLLTSFSFREVTEGQSDERDKDVPIERTNKQNGREKKTDIDDYL